MRGDVGHGENAEQCRADSRAGAEAAQGQPCGDRHAEQGRPPLRGLSIARPRDRARAAPARRRRRPPTGTRRRARALRLAGEAAAGAWVHAASTRAPTSTAMTGGDGNEAASAAGLGDDGLREVRGPANARATGRLPGRARRSARRAWRRPSRATDGAASAAVVSGAARSAAAMPSARNGRDGDEEPRAGGPAPEGQEVRAVVDEEGEAHRKRQRGLAPRVRQQAERQETAQPGRWRAASGRADPCRRRGAPPPSAGSET